MIYGLHKEGVGCGEVIIAPLKDNAMKFEALKRSICSLLMAELCLMKLELKRKKMKTTHFQLSILKNWT